MRDRLINLTFHGIGSAARPLEPGESRVWVSQEQFLSLLNAAVSRDDVAITFDDGNASDVEQALPALHTRGLRATFFVVAGRLGTPGFLDEDGLRALAAAGMEIGCHGMHHRAWRGLEERALHEELVEGRAILERVVDRQVARAACPFGAYDRRVLNTLRRSGYQHVYTSDRGTSRPDDFLQPRNSVGPNDGPGLLEEIAAAKPPTVTTAARRAKMAIKRWR
jgi:peptidoglycan/xylan/chitin deacetylase (PgdA/CDA1 family)